MAINTIDFTISAFFNSCCHKSELFDRTVAFVADNHLLKGGVLSMIIWYLWFSRGPDQVLKRRYITAGLVGTFASMFIARILPHMLTFRARPLLDAHNHFITAYGLDPHSFDNLSSFPSDHCALFFGVATTIAMASRKWGWVAYLYVLAVIVFPRLYLGLHYTSDIIVGGLLGVVMVCLAGMRFFRDSVGKKLLSYETSKPALFYAVFFLITFSMSEMFTSLRAIASFILKPYSQPLL